MNNVFPEVKKNFGFGVMRLPMVEGEIDYEQFTQMVDEFIANGFVYFDTAHPYLEERSEDAVKRCVTSRYERDKYLLANKLSGGYFKKAEDIRPLFEKQLELCGVDYFDFYLMHSQSSNNYEHFVECKAYEQAQVLKTEGKIRHVGFSFHDTPEFLDKILTEHPEVEFVQLQLNYFDMEAVNVQSRACLEVCKKHGKPVIVMEPVKGGKLANILPSAKEELSKVDPNVTPASFAIRYAASMDGVFMVLSGMSELNQMRDNISFMKDFKPLDKKEYDAIDRVMDVLSKLELIECTSCRYCVKGCPKKIDIPGIFRIMNDRVMFQETEQSRHYGFVTNDGGKAIDCIKCGKCEDVCPQHLKIRDLLAKAANLYDKSHA